MKRTDGYLNRNYDFNFDTSVLSIVELIGIVILLFFIIPWLNFWLAYFGGWIAKITIGNQLVLALSYLNIDINKESIPLLAGGLGWVGSFFTSISNLRKDK